MQKVFCIGFHNGLVERHDAFRDNPWPMLYREMDRAYPRSRFILTTRAGSWIASMVGHFGGRTTPMREWIYGIGAPRGEPEVALPPRR